ncbi:MAG: PQQ-binding-like beta-propeller repeat protein [Anaerolineales bacterium]|nr:PQQ-binding-like beta-propeller repeat protein [Anaerolineales bacterium]
MPDPQVKKVACPSCGAPLLFGAGEITTRCTFCHAVVERPLRADQPAALKTRPAISRPSRPSAGSPPANRISIFSFLTLGLGLVAAIASFVVVMALADNGSSAGTRWIFSGAIAALPVDRPEGPDVIALAYDLSNEEYLLVRVDPIAGKVVWRGKQIGESSDVRTIIPGDARFFTVEEGELHAYRSADGTEIWQAGLSDELMYCDECLSVDGNRAIALTQDYVIEAFDTETGASAWKRWMDGYTSGFTIVDGGLWVIDKVEGEYALIMLDLADGSVRRSIAPKCAAPDNAYEYGMNATAKFLFDPDPSVRAPDRAVYIFYGWHPGCIGRWNTATAERVWQTADEDGFAPSGDLAALFTPDLVYFASDDRLWSIAKADGSVRTVAEGGDYELVPLAFEQEILILRTKRTRGTTRFGLRGFDPARGEILWDHPVENGEPYDPPDAAFRHVDEDRAIWTWRFSGGLLHLYTFQADPNRLSFATLNPRDGFFSSGEPLAFDFSYDSYFGPNILFRKGALIWVMADSHLLGIDLDTAEIKYHFP